MNLDKTYKTNKKYLDKKIINKYDTLYPCAHIFLAGDAVYTGSIDCYKYPNLKKESSHFNRIYPTLTLSQRILKEIFDKSTITIKSKMSSKVDILVWNDGVWYSKSDFEKFTAYETRIRWEKFLKPIVEIILQELNDGNIEQS